MKHYLPIACLWISVAVAAAGQTSPQPAPSQPQAPPSPEGQGTQQAPAPQSPATGQAPEPQPQEATPPEGPQDGSNYDKAIFQNPIPGGQLTFLNQFEGAAAGEVARDKQFRKLMQRVIPDCMFHYGRDMPLFDAMDMVLNRSQEIVHIREGRYFLLSGRSGPYLQGRGFLWIDLQEGVALGGFYFRPTNGEPTPAVNAFSRLVKDNYLALSQLPPAFAQDLSEWSAEFRVPPLTTRYFITGSNRKILLEHDEDYCARAQQANAAPDDQCQQMNADAADIDMDAANYLEQTHHATNATAWMITGQDQRSWILVRASTCGDLLACRIRLTRERVRVIIGRPPRPHRPTIRAR